MGLLTSNRQDKSFYILFLCEEGIPKISILCIYGRADMFTFLTVIEDKDRVSKQYYYDNIIKYDR